MPPSKRTNTGSGRDARARPRARRPGSKPAAIELALAALAHDIRTPLTGILSLSQLLEASDLPERERRWAATIRGTAEHLAQLTTLVVDAAKADAGGLVLRPEPFSPAELAEAVAQSLAARADAKGLEVDVVIARSLPAHVAADGLRLRSALENLIDNAVKFTERGRIGFKAGAARLAGGKVRLSFTVTDSGIGMTEADLKRLFRPFTQASEDVARRYGGAGLGLVFVKRIAKAMGGDLEVTSKPGRGSTFRLTLVAQPAAAGGGATGPARARRVRGLRILAVEDNPYGRLVLKAVIGELGHRLDFAGTGEAAIAAVREGNYDAVLMDIELPDMDGAKATRRIRTLPPPAGTVPIVGLSGRTSEDDAAAAALAGMDAYLRKPATPAELNDVLSRLAGRTGRRRRPLDVRAGQKAGKSSAKK